MEESNIKAILWDFDGVLLESNEIRDKGFVEVLNEYPKEEVDQLLAFHQKNGGLSRYVKLRHFFEIIRGENVTDEDIQHWADRFSVIMRELLIDPALRIQETITFVKNNYSKVPMYVVSGSDQNELRFLCKQHGIAPYFKRIHGSPVPKKQWVATILEEENLTPEKCVLIGDSINDFEAANSNNIKFMAYNNDSLNHLSSLSIDLTLF